MQKNLPEKKNYARIITESAVLIALGTVLSLIQVYKMPQGGAVTLGSMVPLLILAARRGPKVGCAAGAIFGIIQCVIDPMVYHPVQFILDYPLAFALLGLSGFVTGSVAKVGLGSVIGMAGRFASHLISGVVFFGQYAPKGQNVWLYSFLYQLSYLGMDMLIAIVAMVILWKPLETYVFKRKLSH
ncbi:MAG TPA: energy-coupled thiamine transporter ThiT [Clostridiales bacterium]|nr:energy-coupled thiamine transporter ThiT [Clostridiales bacterium]